MSAYRNKKDESQIEKDYKKGKKMVEGYYIIWFILFLTPILLLAQCLGCV